MLKFFSQKLFLAADLLTKIFYPVFIILPSDCFTRRKIDTYKSLVDFLNYQNTLLSLCI